MVKHLKTLLLLFLIFEVKGIVQFAQVVSAVQDVNNCAEPPYDCFKFFRLLMNSGLLTSVQQKEIESMLCASGPNLDDISHLIPEKFKEAYEEHSQKMKESAEAFKTYSLNFKIEFPKKMDFLCDLLKNILDDEKSLRIFKEEEAKFAILMDLSSTIEDSNTQISYSIYESILKLSQNCYENPLALSYLIVILENYEALLSMNEELKEKVQSLKDLYNYDALLAKINSYEDFSDLYIFGKNCEGEGFEQKERRNIVIYVEKFMKSLILSSFIAYFKEQGESLENIVRVNFFEKIAKSVEMYQHLFRFFSYYDDDSIFNEQEEEDLNPSDDIL